MTSPYEARSPEDHRVPQGLSPEDEALLRKALRKNPRFAALWHGDTSEYGGDHYRAVGALLAHLAWWTDCDKEQMRRLFRKSAVDEPSVDNSTRLAAGIRNACTFVGNSGYGSRP